VGSINFAINAFTPERITVNAGIVLFKAAFINIKDFCIFRKIIYRFNKFNPFLFVSLL
jgi:hypothetical protein